MEVVELRVMIGPNMWSQRHPRLIVLNLDFKQYSTDQLNQLKDKFSELVPPHVLSVLDMHTDARLGFTHLIAQTGAWLQPGGDKFYSDARVLGENSYYAIFEYEEEEVGLAAGNKIPEVIGKFVLHNEALNFEELKKELKQIYDDHYLGPSTHAIVKAAQKRGIPIRVIGTGKFVLLGQGKYQKKIEASICETTSNISVDIAGDKETTKQLLAEAMIPVPKGVLAHDESEIKKAMEELSFPLVTKPLDGHQGQGITANITDHNGLVKGFRLAREYSSGVIIEKYIAGNDYRFLVIGFKLIAATHRIPAHVTGDGKLTIQELIDQVNADPKRGEGHEKVLTKIKVDEHTDNILKEKKLTLNSILEKGEKLFLKTTANISTGGTAIDVTDEVHPDNIAMVERAAQIIGLDICGIDVMAPDVQRPFAENGGAILEVNAAPGLRMHIAPSEGLPRNVGDPIIDLMYPQGSMCRIPIVAVTGTNGKTTTARLMAHLTQLEGYHVGLTTTDGIYINGKIIDKGDCTGARSSKVVLQDPTVDFAVLECARGGIIRSGLAFDECNIGIVTNVAGDHLGLKDINTIEDLARVKSVIPKSVKKNGFAILNAADDRVFNMQNELDCRIGLFCIDPNHPRIKHHVEEGGYAVVMDENKNIVILKDRDKIIIENVKKIPLTLGGKAEFMIENVMPVVLAAYLLSFSVENIRAGLHTFKPSAEQTPGRYNEFEINGAHIIVDYGHNPHSMKAMAKFLKNIDARKTGIITGVGDRRSEDMQELGRLAAQMYDEVIIRIDKDTRGRNADEIVAHLTVGLKEVNPDIPYKYIPDSEAALKYAVDHAHAGDYIFISVEDVETTISFVKKLQEEYKTLQDE